MIKISDINTFTFVKCRITNHFGINPSRGGIPAMDSNVNIVVVDWFDGNWVEILNSLVVVFDIAIIGRISIIVMME